MENMKETVYFIENDQVRIEFDKKDGSIVRLLNKNTGWEVIKQPLLSCGIEMIVPVPNRRNNKVIGKDQKLHAFVQKSISEVSLEWRGIVGNISGTLDINAKVDVSIDGAQMTFTVTVENNTEHMIEEVWYPCLGGVRPPSEEKDLICRQVNMCGDFNTSTLGDHFTGHLGYWGVDTPMHLVNYPEAGMLLPFEVIDDGEQGMYIGMHDKTPAFFGVMHELKPGFSDSKFKVVPKEDMIGDKAVGFGISAIQMPFITANEKRTLAPVMIELYQGDWHKGVQPYMNWRKTWYEPKDCPKWIRDADCWMTLHINSSEGCCRYRYSELLDIAKDAKDNGVQVLQLIGWARGGQDGDEPLQSIDPRLGTAQELKQAIADIEAIGVRVLLMCKFKWVDGSIPEYKEKIIHFTQRDIFDNPIQFGGYSYQTVTQQIGLSRHRGFGLCHSYDKYREFAGEEFKKLLSLGASGVLYDELTNASQACMSAEHGHPVGECSYVGSLALAEQFYEQGRKMRDDFVLTGEGPADFLTQYYHVNYIRTNPDHIPAWKYINPDMLFATCLIGFDDKNMVNHCIACGYIINFEPYNFKGLASDAKLTTTYATKARDVRARLKDYLWEGEFVDDRGVTLRLSSDTKAYHKVFINRKNNKKAVVIVNEDHVQQAVVRMKIESSSTQSKYDMYLIDTDKKEISSDEAVIVNPQSFVVLIEK